MVRPVCHCGGAHWPMGCSRRPKAPKPTRLQRVRQRIDDARETLTRVAASVRLRASDALDDWAFARLLVPDGPTYEEAVAKVLEEGCSGLYGLRGTVVHLGESFWVEASDDVDGTEYPDVRLAARAFVAIERGEA